MAGTIVVDRIESDGSYASTINVASKVNFTGGMQIGGQDTTFAGMRNRIINGAMMIDQRNAGALVTGATGNIYGVDRFNTGVFGSGTGRISAQQSNTVPSNSGFVKSLINTVTTADASPSQYYGYCLQQKIEGYNTADLMFGTANAKTITLSFWVRSSIVGTYVVTISNENTDRGYSATYTILEANTWEQKTITVVGDTTGTWYTTTNAGIILTWGLGGGTGRQAPSLNAWNSGAAGGYTITDATGCVDWIATSGATFLLTGVQLEKGSAATAFEYRQYGNELALCMRYYQSVCVTSADTAGSSGAPMRLTAVNNGGTQPLTGWQYPVAMRTAPSIQTYGAGVAGGSFVTYDSGGGSASQTSFSGTDIGPKGCRINLTGRSGSSYQYWSDCGPASGQLGWTQSAEL